MFGLFKKKESAQIHISLMKLIFSTLGKRFDYINLQLAEGIIKGVKRREKPALDFIFSLDIEILYKYEDKQGKYFAIKKIFVNDAATNQPVEIKIEIGYGILLSYSPLNIKGYCLYWME